jgi:hypothetical protein
MATRFAGRWACAAIAALTLVSGPLGPASAAHTRVSFELYHEALAPHGSWHVSKHFGRVWIPRTQVLGWHPYAYGHWVYSDFGWTWVSAYEWGAIPYHYGTWTLDSELGWAWVPGYVWAPAWVAFRSGPSYVGWAPVPPGYSLGAPLPSDYGADHYVFVREGDFLARDVHRVAVPIERARDVFEDTQVVADNLRIENDVVVNRGIDVARVERLTRASVERAPIERVPRIAPVEHVTRDALRVDPSRIERGRVRAAAPQLTIREIRSPRPERGEDRRSPPPRG